MSVHLKFFSKVRYRFASRMQLANLGGLRNAVGQSGTYGRAVVLPCSELAHHNQDALPLCRSDVNKYIGIKMRKLDGMRKRLPSEILWCRRASTSGPKSVFAMPELLLQTQIGWVSCTSVHTIMRDRQCQRNGGTNIVSLTT